MFKIVQKKNRNAVYASGFYDMGRAQAWLERYDPKMWTDKSITRDDLEIVEESKPSKSTI